MNQYIKATVHRYNFPSVDLKTFAKVNEFNLHLADALAS